MTETEQSAVDAILQELSRLRRMVDGASPMSDGLAQIERKCTECSDVSPTLVSLRLSRISDIAIELKADTESFSPVANALELVASIARYGFDVRNTDERARHGLQ